MRLSGLLLTLLLLAGAAGAKVYKWRDANGQVVYSQTPPPPELQTEAETVAPPPPPASAPARKAPAAKPAEPAAPAKAQKAGKPPQAKAPSPAGQAKKAEALAAKCERARKALNELRIKNRIMMPDGKGGYRVMTAEERAAQRRRLESDLRKHCR